VPESFLFATTPPGPHGGGPWPQSHVHIYMCSCISIQATKAAPVWTGGWLGRSRPPKESHLHVPRVVRTRRSPAPLPYGWATAGGLLVAAGIPNRMWWRERGIAWSWPV